MGIWIFHQNYGGYPYTKKHGILKLILGIVSFLIGVVFMYFWLPQIIEIFLGFLGIILAIIGIKYIISGYFMIRNS